MNLFIQRAARLTFTARIEGPLLHRRASASKKDDLAAPYFFPIFASSAK